MKLLVLGGTIFLGRHVVETALERGHRVTIFTRGRTNPDLFPAAGRLHRDRDGDLTVLRACAEATDADVRFTWASDEFLLNHGVEPWSDLPLWLPHDVPGPILDSRKALAMGLRCRPFGETVRDVMGERTVVSQAGNGPARPSAMGRQRERELLRLLAEHAGKTVERA